MSLPGAGSGRHPVVVVAGLNDGQLDAMLGDEAFVAAVDHEVAALAAVTDDAAEPEIAYCSPEFGMTALVPQYAGGLGILAGDHLKTASDLGIPIVGVGLFYRHGVFRQVIEDGLQVEAYHQIEPEQIGAVDTGVVVEVPFPDREVSARVWRVDVGRIPLILLDSRVESNSSHDREITDRLYIGFGQHRVDQEMILGVGGARALTALGWDIAVHHLNEGHAGFIVFELIDRVIEGADLAAAVNRVKPGLVFTTHTPVPAGIDRFDRDLLTPYLERWAQKWGTPVGDLWHLGVDPSVPDAFNMAALCLRTVSIVNGVSKLHGEVSRHLFAGIGLGDQIGSVTNGVHARTWTAGHIQEVFDEVMGPAWDVGDPRAWERVEDIEDQQLDGLRRQGSLRLAEMISTMTGDTADPDALIIGFARRFAPYKRANLLFRETERLVSLLTDGGRPLHFVFAGKAHPADEPGKSLVAEIVRFSRSTDGNGRFTFIPDYDMEIAHALVQGCDVWLNNPIRPREASGTSGEKAVLNGCLNCSILDGWWAEMYDGQNGWGIAASEETDPHARDTAEAAWLLETIESIRDEYHAARPQFNSRIRYAWRTLGPQVTAARMVREYQDRIYGPALGRVREG